MYGGLQQPSLTIPSEITKLTGITNEMVAGQVIDMAALRILIDPADLINAHNAGFDRPAKHFALSSLGKLGPLRTPRSTGRLAVSKKRS